MIPDDPATTRQAIAALQSSYRSEIQSARAYRDLAECETNPQRKAVLLRMAEAEQRHADRWERKLKELGVEPRPVVEGFFGRIKRWISRSEGTVFTIRRMEAEEDRMTAKYETQNRLLAEDKESRKILHEIATEEKAHAKALAAMVPQLGARTVLDSILHRERWHGRGGGWVSDAIYGVNDGLGAVFGIVSGVAGATDNARQTVLIAGLAGMIASALSMGAGAYLAVKSEREVYEAEIAAERKEVDENPEEEMEEMALFYQLQGFDEAQSKQMAQRLAQDPEQLTRAMTQSELGLAEEHFRNPWVSATSAAASTAVGAFVPIIPFFFMGGLTAVIVAFAISIAAHFAVGAAKTLITNRKWWASGLEMTMVGVIEAAVTYGIGRAVAPMFAGKS